MAVCRQLLTEHFYPRPPRGGRPTSMLFAAAFFLFLSTPSARRATVGGAGRKPSKDISIHALREEGDLIAPGVVSPGVLFLSTPSARRATLQTAAGRQVNAISIHALREEGDICTNVALTIPSNFYPRPPRGGRQIAPGVRVNLNKFLSTPSARRATAKTETKSLFSNKLYNILHEFRRALIYNGSKNYPNHAKRHKNPVRRCRKDAENSPFAPGRETQNNSRPSCSKGG